MERAIDIGSLRVRPDDPEDLSAAQAAAERADVLYELAEKPEPTGAFEPRVEPVTAILIGGAVMAVGKFIIDWWERRRGGLVVDLRPEAVDNLYRDKDVPFGFVVTFLADGKVTIETKEIPKDAMERLLGEIVSGVFGSAKALASAAKHVAGAGIVTTEPATT
jgi:hypothetical protein